MKTMLQIQSERFASPWLSGQTTLHNPPYHGVMKRIVKVVLKRLGVAAGMVVLLVLIQATLLLYPDPLFSHHIAYRNFRVHSVDPIPAEITTVLDRTAYLLSRSPIYDPSQIHEICLCQGTRMVKFLLLREVHFGANIATGTTFITYGDVVNDRSTWFHPAEGESPSRTLSGVIVHEIIHHQIRTRVGFRADRRLPEWIKEGYCDVVARESGVDPEWGIDVLLSRGSKAGTLRHFTERIMVDYLLNDAGWSVDDLLTRPPDRKETLDRALASLRTRREEILRRLTEDPPVPPRPGLKILHPVEVSQQS